MNLPAHRLGRHICAGFQTLIPMRAGEAFLQAQGYDVACEGVCSCCNAPVPLCIPIVSVAPFSSTMQFPNLNKGHESSRQGAAKPDVQIMEEVVHELCMHACAHVCVCGKTGATYAAESIATDSLTSSGTTAETRPSSLAAVQRRLNSAALGVSVTSDGGAPSSSVGD